MDASHKKYGACLAKVPDGFIMLIMTDVIKIYEMTTTEGAL